MEVNYILLKGDKHFKCYNLAEMAIYFSLSIASNGSVTCDGYQDTMSYSKEWSHEQSCLYLWKFVSTNNNY